MPSDDVQPVPLDERTRICPSCRCTIPLLATKCRFCGEEVGKPKEETRELTAADLGGETIYHRAPSGSVMDALEAFRAEESAAIQAARQAKAASRSSLFRRRKTGKSKGGGTHSSDGLPELDEKSKEFMSLFQVDDAFRSYAVPAKRPVPFVERILPIGATAGALIVIIFLGIKGVEFLTTYLENRDRPPEIEYTSRAPRLLEQGASSIEILQAAVGDLSAKPTSEHEKMVERALALVQEEVEGLLNADPWSIERINRASILAARAALIKPSEASIRLKRDAEAEHRLYQMILKDIDPGGPHVVFLYINEAKERVTSPPLKVGDILEGRFQVKRILSNMVVLEDLMRKNRAGLPRQITFEVTNPIAH